MGKISTYSTATPTLTDKVIGTDTNSNNETNNFTVGSILQLLSTVGTVTLTAYADNNAAIAGGLISGQLYRNAGAAGSSSVVCVVY